MLLLTPTNMKNTLPTLTLLTALLLYGCKQDYAGQTSEATPTSRAPAQRVTVQPLRSSQEPVPIVASGVLASQSEAGLSFKIGGIVQTVDVEAGQYVEQGQRLASLDQAEINAQVTQARNSYEKAERDLRRATRLYEDTVATLEQQQNAQTAFEVAQANLEIAEFNRRYARIVAPVDGKVLEKHIEANELVTPGQPVLTIGGSGREGAQVISVGLADQDIVRVALNDTARVVFDAFPDRPYRARVTQIAEAANPNTGTFAVELTLEGAYVPELKNGFVGKVQLFPLNTPPYYRIPMAALVEGNRQQARVYLTQDQARVRSQTLAVSGIHRDYFTVAAAAIQEPAWVVLQGNAYLSDNDSIQVITH